MLCCSQLQANGEHVASNPLEGSLVASNDNFAGREEELFDKLINSNNFTLLWTVFIRMLNENQKIWSKLKVRTTKRSLKHQKFV